MLAMGIPIPMDSPAKLIAVVIVLAVMIWVAVNVPRSK